MNVLIAQVLVYKDRSKPCLHGMGGKGKKGEPAVQLWFIAAGGQVRPSRDQVWTSWCLWCCMEDNTLVCPGTVLVVRTMGI